VVVSPEELAAQLESMRGELTAATERIDSLEAELVAVRETLEEMRRTRSSLSFTAPLQAFEEALRGDQPPPDETHWVADG
jgi:predicted  nucleic acid-binding Zn-ribbon protein